MTPSCFFFRFQRHPTVDGSETGRTPAKVGIFSVSPACIASPYISNYYLLRFQSKNIPQIGSMKTTTHQTCLCRLFYTLARIFQKQNTNDTTVFSAKGTARHLVDAEAKGAVSIWWYLGSFGESLGWEPVLETPTSPPLNEKKGG